MYMNISNCEQYHITKFRWSVSHLSEIDTHPCSMLFLLWFDASHHSWGTQAFYSVAILDWYCHWMWHFKHNSSSQLLPDTTKLLINMILAMLIILSKHFLKYNTNKYVFPSWFYTWKLKGRSNMFVLRESNMQVVMCFSFQILCVLSNMPFWNSQQSRFRYRGKHTWTALSNSYIQSLHFTQHHHHHVIICHKIWMM